MKPALLLAALAVFLVACTPPLTRFTRPDTTQQQFMKDRYECLQEAEQRVSGAFANSYGAAASSHERANCGLWYGCLAARGYALDKAGDLAAPQGTAVLCYR
jgi:hypothetical protein